MSWRYAVAALTLLSSACRQQTASARNVEIPALDENARFTDGATGSAHIEYQHGVHLVEREDILTSLLAVSRDGSTLLFDSPPQAVSSLKAGDVLVVKRLFARKVVATRTIDGQLALLTTSAALGEIIRNGKIELNVPLRFSSGTADIPSEWLHSVKEWTVPTAYAQAPPLKNGRQTLKNFEKETGLDRLKNAERQGEKDAAKKLASSAVSAIVSGWTVAFSAVPEGKTGLRLKMKMTKSKGGFLGAIDGDGFIGDFNLASRIDVNDGIVDQLETGYSGLNGLMNFTWEIGKETPGGYSEKDYVKLPGALTIPLYKYLDGFPLFLEVSAAAIIQPVMTAGQQYSTGAFRISYDGQQGFTAREGKIDTDGKVTGGVNFLSGRSASAVAPVAMVLNLAAPRFELTMNPYKALGDVLKSMKDVSLFEKVAKGSKTAEKMGKIFEKGEKWFGKQVAGQDRVDQAAQVLENGASMMKSAADIVKTDATAYMQLVAMSATTATGASAIVPCSHTDLGISMQVGTSAQGFGRKVQGQTKTVFEKKVTRVIPQGIRYCEY